jgi:DNA-directed RNA polymerase subunit RPC12/RpoP
MRHDDRYQCHSWFIRCSRYWNSLIDHNHFDLKYFCVQCGSELSINEQTSTTTTSTKSHECLRCGYTLLYGGIKKHRIAKKASIGGMH